MSQFQNKYRIESIRLPNWDYRTAAYYYVTICTKNKYIFFGDVANGKMILNDLGKIVEDCWNEIPKHFPTVELDYVVIMPNHLHGIVIIGDTVETGHAPSLPKCPSLSNIIGSFKSAVTRLIHKSGKNDFHWQPRFYEHIIRNERSLHSIREYIQTNPIKWSVDEYYAD